MRSSRHFRRFKVFAFVFVLLVALPSLAVEDSSPNPADTTAGVVFRWINFLIVAGGIGYLIAKYGGTFFRANAQAIASGIREATAAKAEAQRELQAVDAKIARLDQEIGEMREAARQNWAAEAERLRTSGLAEIDKINQAARAELAAAERAAHQQLREIAATMAVRRAAELVSSRMKPEVRARMFQTFLEDLVEEAN